MFNIFSLSKVLMVYEGFLTMARRSDHSRAELSEMAIGAARDIVAKDGLGALTARGVAHAIGYSPGTLYNLFNDLDDLVVHVSARTLDDLYAHLSPAEPTGEPIDDLRSLLRLYLGFLKTHPNLWNALFEYEAPKDRRLPDWYGAKVSKVLGLIEVALSPLFAADAHIELATSARVLWASLHGICSLSESGKLQVVGNQTVEDMAEILITCFISGLETASAHAGRKS